MPELVIFNVPGRGWCYRLTTPAGAVIGRGEFRQTPAEALERALMMVEQIRASEVAE